MTFTRQHDVTNEPAVSKYARLFSCHNSARMAWPVPAGAVLLSMYSAHSGHGRNGGGTFCMLVQQLKPLMARYCKSCGMPAQVCTIRMDGTTTDSCMHGLHGSSKLKDYGKHQICMTSDLCSNVYCTRTRVHLCFTGQCTMCVYLC